MTGVLYVYIPKGFFPTQDTGVIIGISDAAQSGSFGEMSRIQQELQQVIMKDPDVQSVSSTVGAGDRRADGE